MFIFYLFLYENVGFSILKQLLANDIKQIMICYIYNIYIYIYIYKCSRHCLMNIFIVYPNLASLFLRISSTGSTGCWRLASIALANWTSSSSSSSFCLLSSCTAAVNEYPGPENGWSLFSSSDPLLLVLTTVVGSGKVTARRSAWDSGNVPRTTNTEYSTHVHPF